MAARSKHTPLIPRYVQRKVQNSLIYLFLFLLMLTMMVGVYRGGVHLVELTPEQVTISELPYALTLSFLRMAVSYVACLFFAYALGLAAARSPTGERIIIPLLDIFQSVPVVAFFPAAIGIFIGLTSGHRIGIELAATFLIFTSQAWNMAFAVYEATKTIPQDNLDAIATFGVKGSQRFWKLYAPAAVPRLIYNSILSWTNGWFFLVSCEIIAVGRVKYDLPGIGSFLARAAENDQIRLVIWGLLALASLILLMDFFIWRPLSLWAERFRQEQGPSSGSHAASRVTFANALFQRLAPFSPFSPRSNRRSSVGRMAARMFSSLGYPVIWTLREVILPILWDLPAALVKAASRSVQNSKGLQYIAQLRAARIALTIMIGAVLGAWFAVALFRWLSPPWPPFMSDIPLAILASTGRLLIALAISLAWTLPVVLWCWDKPRIRRTLTTVAQVGASLPAIALFPLIIFVLVRKLGGGMEAASILLLLTGMQWYILFNLLGGAAVIPGDLIEATRSMGLSRVQQWKRILLPALRPALITGSITAWGGGWNALVVSEFVPYKGETLRVLGLGALLNQSVYELGDGRAIMICITAMVTWIILINTIVWRPLYRNASERYKFDA